MSSTLVNDDAHVGHRSTSVKTDHTTSMGASLVIDARRVHHSPCSVPFGLVIFVNANSRHLRKPSTNGSVLVMTRSEIVHQYNPEVAAGRVVRAGAVLGVVGGGLRAAGSFAPVIASDHARTWLYVTIDLCLTAGLLSIYLQRRHRMRAAGLIGFLLALVGLIAGRISPAVTAVNLYPVTAAAVLIGVSAFALSEWRERRMAAWIPMTFALSLVVGGIGTFVAGTGPLFVASGILFGCAFAAMAVTAP